MYGTPSLDWNPSCPEKKDHVAAKKLSKAWSASLLIFLLVQIIRRRCGLRFVWERTKRDGFEVGRPTSFELLPLS